MNKSAMATALLAAGLSVAAPLPALAHHSFAQFDIRSEREISGEIYAIEWANPHVWIWLKVRGPDGTVTPWGFEGAAPGELMRWGFAKNALKKGDQVKVKYHPMANGKPGGSFESFTLAGGRVVGMPPPPPKQR